MRLTDWLDAMRLPERADDESDADYTDRAIREGGARGVNRQCSIGYHEECSDPSGERCRCVCHRSDAPSYGELAGWLAGQIQANDRLREALHVVLDEVDLLRAYSDRLFACEREGCPTEGCDDHDPQHVWGYVGRVERAGLHARALLADGDEDGDR